ncbi:MAG: 50S ribosomal protein L21 [Candidatus Kerfeldbacteria bacterium CG15_BIG_FIL_POST_REV_8_21_14_020_45_12]|uniref:Large ribosomal subunit protein bL21 n=1 Tax=Candidatus Kerfeldbacteria bacterium CG15_BIG_FIL_POST_REV_8_21_14_020_45_12 TaxID=2014247 RepID=A0A2M7H3U6_9BACT|nr:MAG: 50S ribosomal protein L21 [Candidatus Kerfeldbacteria bacterium CG15_BIG_FIL_POST_REV_8_21_14_020_45_12]PJA94009.1 MAG: 50S ribosomal protein L21 [Candidatus Kerfeldbacteria bacterium CG_4_9_14_3_um_filter_45_8]
MIAVISTGGKQYKVSEGGTLKIEKLEVEEGKNISFDEVLLVSKPDGSDVKLGTPTLEGAKVTAKVLKQARAKKIEVSKFKAKSRYSKTYGHRQPYTEVEITKIAV